MIETAAPAVVFKGFLH